MKKLFILIVVMLGIASNMQANTFAQKKVKRTVPQKTVISAPKIPTAKELGKIFTSMEKKQWSAITKYGFSLIEKKSKTEKSEYEDGGKYVVNKRVYQLLLNDKKMKITYVYSNTYGDPSMTIECDIDTWNSLKQETVKTMKHFVENSYFINEYAYISFDTKGIVKITTESSLSW